MHFSKIKKFILNIIYIDTDIDMCLMAGDPLPFLLWEK